MLEADTIAYVLASRPAFDACRDALGQMAGLMILAAAGSRDWRERGLLELAGERLESAQESLREASPTAVGRHHQDHLEACVALLRKSYACARSAIDLRDAAPPVLALLRAASPQLPSASAALPGFPVVTLDGCCCGKPHPRRAT